MTLTSNALCFSFVVLITHVTQSFSIEFDCESESACVSTIVNNDARVCCYGFKSCTNARLTSYYGVGEQGALSGFMKFFTKL